MADKWAGQYLSGTFQKFACEIGVFRTNEKSGEVQLFVKNRFEIRFRYKGKLHKATVRKDGSIFFKGTSYNSPSLAAVAITKRAVNGWTAWSCERAPGDWVILDVLRKK